MSKFRQWYLTNNTEITWFIIGLLVSGGLEALVRGDYVNAGMSFVLVLVNYYFNKK